MKPFFSIIIPIYNGLSHDLPICLSHIWSQPLDADLYEVICIDDCSTDGSVAWLKQQQAEHPNLLILENERNLRQGGARNRGFREAKGKYIMLVDQDDYYHDGVFAEIYQHLKDSDLDLLIVDCAYQTPGHESNKLQHNFKHREVMTGDEMIERNSIPYAPWKFIFRRSMILDNNLFFEENERIEDVDWVHKMTHYAQKAQYQPFLFVHYNKGDMSTTMSSYRSSETVYSSLRMAKRLGVWHDTIFKDSSDKVKSYINYLERRFYYLGLRNYFFFYDKIGKKELALKQTICSSNSEPYNLIAKLFRTFPKIMSAISNLLCPACRLAMVVYRKLKYIAR